MFGACELQLPAAFTNCVTDASQCLPEGRVAGVLAMGGISALIVSPCGAAPLTGARVYLSQTRDVVLGGSALFALAAGMSVPLVLIGASAVALLQRTGAWMNEVKRFFGVMLLGVALWTVQSVLPGSLALGLWGALTMCAAVLVASSHAARDLPITRSLWRRVVAAVLAACGLLQWAGAASGGANLLQPLAHLAGSGRAAPGQAVRGSAPQEERRIASEGRRHRQWRTGSRAAQALRAVRAATHDLLRRASPRVDASTGRRVPEHADLSARIGRSRALNSSGLRGL